MGLIGLGVIILTVGLLIALAIKAFNIFSIIVFYHVVKSILTFEVAVTHLGIDSGFIHFMFVLTLAFFLHYLIVVRLLAELYPYKVGLFILCGFWILFNYETLELLRIKDWMDANGLWGVENFQDAVKQLFSTPVDEQVRYLSDGMKNFGDILWGIIDALKLGAETVIEFVKGLFAAKGTE